jgi:hypothetical protein
MLGGEDGADLVGEQSKFAFRLSMKPIVRPASDPGSGGTLSVSPAATPTGLRTLIWLMTFSV